MPCTNDNIDTCPNMLTSLAKIMCMLIYYLATGTSLTLIYSPSLILISHRSYLGACAT
jgi:fatty-acid desaturase